MTPNLNRLDETVQMKGHNVWFQWEIRKIMIKYPPLIELRYRVIELAKLYYAYVSLGIISHILFFKSIIFKMHSTITEAWNIGYIDFKVNLGAEQLN